MRIGLIFTLLFVMHACASLETPGPIEEKEDGFGKTTLRCGGHMRVRVDSSSGTCLGLVAESDSSFFRPRVLLELPQRDNEFLVSDLGNWVPGKGRLWHLDARRSDNVTLRPVLTGLTVPHQIAIGPDGWIYFGEDARISAFPPEAVSSDGEVDAAQIVAVLRDLPPIDVNGERNSMHPVSHFIFDTDGDLLITVGAYTDHCEAFAGMECREVDRQLPLSAGDDPAKRGAVIRRYDRVGERLYDSSYRVIAHGLRNSMGLVLTPNGDLIQVENSRDFPESDRPFEELNVIPRAEVAGEAPAKHYGWPYCYDTFETSDEWANYAEFRCSADNPDYRPPYIVLPPHSAPLGLMYYQGDLFEELRGTLLVPLHGFRPSGQRLLSYQVDAEGLPVRNSGATYLENPTSLGLSVEVPYPDQVQGAFTATGQYLIDAWFEVGGIRPKGAPVTATVSRDGAIWIASDKNRAILRMDLTDENLPKLRKENLYPAYRRALDTDPGLRAKYQDMVDRVLHSQQCMGCHDDFRFLGEEDRYPELRYLLSLGTWLHPGAPDASVLFTKLQEGGMPPLGREWPTLDAQNAAVASVENFILSMPSLEPGLNDGWIGGQCTPGFNSDCAYEDGRCTSDGFCTLACTRDQPFCPDLDGATPTFCVDLGTQVGGCVAKCDLNNPSCLPGQSCVSRPRFGRSSPSAGVCL